VASFLWSRGITRIDAIVLSHADIDHYNGIPGLLERFSVGGIYVSTHMFGASASPPRGPQSLDQGPNLETSPRSAPEYFRSIIQAKNVPLHEISRPDRLPTADPRSRLKVLHPGRQGVAGRDNANSVLLAVEYARWRILLPGDLETPGLEAVMARTPYDCDVLLAPHHGSVHSDPAGFAAWCTPQWVVVSGQQPARGSTMAYSYQQQGAQVLYTTSQGAVRFALTNEGMSVYRFRSTCR